MKSHKFFNPCHLLFLCFAVQSTTYEMSFKAGGPPLKDTFKMMSDMILLCTTLALSLFFWMLSLTLSVYSGQWPCRAVDCQVHSRFNDGDFFFVVFAARGFEKPRSRRFRGII